MRQLLQLSVTTNRRRAGVTSTMEFAFVYQLQQCARMMYAFVVYCSYIHTYIHTVSSRVYYYFHEMHRIACNINNAVFVCYNCKRRICHTVIRARAHTHNTRIPKRPHTQYHIYCFVSNTNCTVTIIFNLLRLLYNTIFKQTIDGVSNYFNTILIRQI